MAIEGLDVLAWQDGLAGLKARLGALFRRRDTRRQAGLYLEGLLSVVERKNGWQLAEAIGDARPWRTQRVLSQVQWDQDAGRDLCRDYVLEHLGDEDGVLVVDETGFLKKGSKSAGVARQYSGTAGRIENCQIGVFLAYASRHGHALIDRELYLPKEWADAPERRAAAAVPEAVGFATKPALAQRMIARALDAGVSCTWVLGDEIYGSDRRLRMFLEQRKIPFVLAVRGNETLWSMLDGSLRQHAAPALAAAVPSEEWQCLSAGKGSKGERLYDWARVRLVRLQEPPWDHWLLVRRNRKDPEHLAFYVVFGSAKTSLAMLARVAGRRWIIEECFEAAKQETGLDEYEIRSWHGWYRHVTLSMLALAFLAALRAQCKDQKGAQATDFPSWCRSACRSCAAFSPTSAKPFAHPISP